MLDLPRLIPLRAEADLADDPLDRSELRLDLAPHGRAVGAQEHRRLGEVALALDQRRAAPDRQGDSVVGRRARSLRVTATEQGERADGAAKHPADPDPGRCSALQRAQRLVVLADAPSQKPWTDGHPWSAPIATRITSSFVLGPCSATYRSPVSGWMTIP